MRAAALAGCLALSGSALLSCAGARDAPTVEDPAEPPREDPGQHLGVIVPVYEGDLSRAVSSLERWPSRCSSVTERNADLVLYYAEGEEHAPAVTAAVETIRKTAGHCFAETRLVYAHLSEEEDVYPKGPSVMFFKMFLDEGVHADLSEYDALAIIEWDVLVASDRSFEELHNAAFRGNEDFWVKGSNLGGTNFHSTAQATDMWKVLGHINGNALYNNNDPAFVEYVDYTRARWEYVYPYDVALWLTISDFPYSWPLWQRYSSKFVTTNLISYVGYEHVDHSTVSDAVAGQTLFIHGSRVDEGNLASLDATKHERLQAFASGRRLSDDTETPPPACNAACGIDVAGLPVGTSTVCDDTCDGASARFDGLLCGAGDSDRFGPMCRLCYVDVGEARRQEQSLALMRSDVEGGPEASHVIMCDTMRPPEAAECSEKCGLKKDTVCDESCGTGRYGDYNCNWRDHGPKCRFCFDNLETALMADQVAQRRGGRVIMCSTFEPPLATSESDVMHSVSPTKKDVTTVVVQVEPPARTSPSRTLQANTCDAAECPHMNSNGFRGRICDDTCADGIPNGTNGCGAREGRFGDLCRVCFFDVARALANDAPGDRAIMCTTGLPVDVEEAANICDVDECPHVNSNGFRGRICDDTCADGIPNGMNGCNAREGRFGNLCRVCFFDVDRALANDAPGDRAIMCDTGMPVDPNDAAADTCDVDECPRINSNGLRGRICDATCADGIPNGTNGCNAREGRFGSLCRVCFVDMERALENDSIGDRAIMCDTMLPVERGYSRLLVAVAEGSAPLIGKKLKAWKESPTVVKDVDENFLGRSKHRTLQEHLMQTGRWTRKEVATAVVVQVESPAIASPSRTLQANTCDAAECPHVNSNGFRGRICDDTCADGIPNGTNGCGAREGRFGDLCRVCFFDVARALANDAPGDRAIMCTTGLPVDLDEATNTCDVDECPHVNSNGFRGRICDDTCADGIPNGMNGCNAREGRFGNLCRVCFFDVDRALANDAPGDRSIMCDTGMPVDPNDAAADTCDVDECPRINSNGLRGRICDATCADGIPNGTNGCNAREGRFGSLCRVCFVDMERALENDSPGDRAIMCDTMLPVEVDDDIYRRLSAVVADSPKLMVGSEMDDAQSMFADATILPYVNDLVRGNLCAFIGGDVNEVEKVEVAVMSVLQFLPGMTVAVATDSTGFHAYQRAVGVLPGVTVHSTEDPFTASLFADQYCGVDTNLIFYMKPDSVVSRMFTSKDTHSNHGDLLVMHGSGKVAYYDRELAKETAAVLGFQSPSFTFNTDLFLPVGANADLREVLVSGRDNEERERDEGALEVLQGFMKLRNMSAVPQLMAALAYSRNTPGVWFVDPQAWVSQHLFKTASIWEIPLVKPRYTCSIDPLAMKSNPDDIDVTLVLQSNLDYFVQGGTCDSGYIDIRRGD